MSTETAVAGRPSRRADAERNRRRILEAARQLFAERGLRAGVDQVAARAGVGVGTLYRHFPAKADLVDAVFDETLEELGRIAEQAFAYEDAWEGLVAFLEGVLELQAADRGFKDLLMARLRENPRLVETWGRSLASAEHVIARAQERGVLRGDVTIGDIRALFWATGHVMDVTATGAPDYWRRFLALVLDGLRTPSPTPLRVPPLPRGHLPAPRR